MKRLYYTIPLFALLLGMLVVSSMSAQESIAPATYSGTEYLVAFPRSDSERTHQFMGLLITSEFTTNGFIEIPDVPTSDLEPITSFQTRSFTVRRGQTTMIEIPRPVEPRFSDEKSLATVRVVSRAPISVTVISARQNASGGYQAIAVDRWGTNYLPTALPAPAPTETGVTSQLLITAAEMGTEVTIKPEAATNFSVIGEEIRIKLNARETYLLQARPDTGIPDLSGTVINSNKPIAVIAGHVRTALSGKPGEIFPSQTYSAWHAIMQTPEYSETWGTEYLSVAMRSGGDRFRLMAREANTTVRATQYDEAGNIAGERVIILGLRGQEVDVYTPDGMALNGPVRWTSDKPFSLTQLRLSNGDNSDPNNSPAMVRVIPTSQFASHSVFGLPTSIKGNRFNPFELQMIARGDGNPFENISIDGAQATTLANVTIKRINGNLWHLQGTIPTGSHSITAANGVTFTGHVSGNNGALGGVTLAWELPTWTADIERDVTPPRVASWNPASNTSVSVQVTDSTSQYFSGVETVEVYDSPGWETDPFSLPTDPGVDVYTSFYVKNGVDPSGPLSLRLVDYDGNESIIKVFDGVCQKTAYPEVVDNRIEMKVENTAPQQKIVRFNANPCGDEAHIQGIALDPVGSAYPHFEAPFLNGGSAPYTILPNGYAEITLRTKADLPNGNYVTTLEVTIDGELQRIPVSLKVEKISNGVNDGTAEQTRLLTVAPNPAVGGTRLRFAQPLGREEAIEIVDGRGNLVRTFAGKEYAGSREIDWNGTEANGNPAAPGVYFISLKSAGQRTTERIVLLR